MKQPLLLQTSTEECVACVAQNEHLQCLVGKRTDKAQLAALVHAAKEQSAQINFNPGPQHSTAQHSTAQHSTAQHSTAQHSTAQQGRNSLLQTTDSPAPTHQGLTHEVSASVYPSSLYCSTSFKCCSLRMKQMIVQSMTALPSVADTIEQAEAWTISIRF